MSPYANLHNYTSCALDAVVSVLHFYMYDVRIVSGCTVEWLVVSARLDRRDGPAENHGYI